MSNLILGIELGVAAGAIAVALMLPMRFPDKRAALLGAFASRFLIVGGALGLACGIGVMLLS